MIELKQTQFPFGSSIPTGNKSNSSGLTIIVIASVLLVGGALFYWQILNKKNETK